MGFGDQMHMGEGIRVKLDCAHNHPEQKLGEVCKLCGQSLPHQEVRNEQKDESGSSNR